MHIKKTLTLKGTKKSEEKPELQKRKSNLFNEKLELIKISKYTHKKIYTQQQDYVLTDIGEKQWSKTTQHGFSVKGKKNPNMHKHTHTCTQKTRTQYFSTIYSIYNKHKFRIILQCFLS